MMHCPVFLYALYVAALTSSTPQGPFLHKSGLFFNSTVKCPSNSAFLALCLSYSLSKSATLAAYVTPVPNISVLAGLPRWCCRSSYLSLQFYNNN